MHPSLSRAGVTFFAAFALLCSGVAHSVPQSMYAPAQHGASFQACAEHFPNRQPFALAGLDARWRLRGLCSDNFAVLYSALTKTPLVVVERLNRAVLADAADEVRTDEFFSDPRLARQDSAQLEDYTASGYDRGHLAAAANQPTAAAMAQSFALSNVVPQHPQNNRKTWAKLESDTRKYVRRAAGDVFVFTGPLYRDVVKQLAPSQVWVPTHLYKLVYDATTGKRWAHVIPNTNDARLGPPMSYEAFVELTGLALLPPK